MKKMLQAIIALLLTLNCFSQTFIPPPYAEIDNNHRDYVNNLFGMLEVNRVPTGLLMGLLLSANPSSNGSNWQWSVDYLSSGSDIYIDNPNSSWTNVNVSGGGTVKLTYTDLCGTIRTDGVTVYSNCPTEFGFAVTPNPAQDNVKVSSNNKTMTKSSSPNLVYAIKITDRFGIIRKSFEYKAGNKFVNISLSDLNSGLYLISVFDGTKWSNQQLVVQK